MSAVTVIVGGNTGAVPASGRKSKLREWVAVIAIVASTLNRDLLCACQRRSVFGISV